MPKIITSTKVREAAKILLQKGELGKHDFVVAMEQNSDVNTYCMMGAIGTALSPKVEFNEEVFNFGDRSKFYKAVSTVFPEKFEDLAFYDDYPEIVIDAVASFNDRKDTTLDMAVAKLIEIADLMDRL